MNLVKLFISLLWCVLIVFGLNSTIQIGDSSLPPLAPLFSPFEGFWQQAEAVSRRKQYQSIKLEGLKAAVNVWFDDQMIPHIFAQNDLDAIRAQGYIEARERLWQMDLSTRNAAGRLAEIFGPALLERDRLQRRKGLAFAAEKTAEKWLENPEINAIISAYSDGVNSYIDQLNLRDLPIEFKLIQYNPEKWSAYKTALFYKSMAQVLCSYGPDIHLNNTRLYLGDSLFQDLFPEYIDKVDPVIPDQEIWNSFQPSFSGLGDVINIDEIIYSEQMILPPKGIGSNNWAVSGKKTTTGSPILCNDPHLSLTLPSVWYELHIHTPDWNSYGVSFPGAPGIIIGFNENIAWGFTNASMDVLDWFKLDWEDKAFKTYNYEGNIEKIDYHLENFKIKGEETVTDSVKYSKWGPVVYENDSFGLAMRWVAHDAPDKPDLLSFYDISKSANWTEFVEASNQYISPAQNMIFASNSGDIGLRVNGRYPERTAQQGRFVRSGDLCFTEWDCFIPNDQLPTQFNPDRQFVSSANQRSVSENYPFYVTGMFEFYRNRYINQRLEKMDSIHINDMMNMQYDKFSLKASEYLPFILQLISENIPEPETNTYIEKLKKWDFRYLENSQAAGFFDLWFNQIQRLTYDELYAVRDSFNVIMPEEHIWLQIAEQNLFHQIFDLVKTEDIEYASEIVYLAFNEALLEANAIEKENGYFSWSLVNKPSIPHVGRIEAFGASNLEASGSKDAINALHHSFGPSWRMIVSLDSEPKAWGEYPGGQSGNPGSHYYDSSLENWSKGNYRALFFTSDTLLLEQKAILKTKFNP